MPKILYFVFILLISPFCHGQKESDFYIPYNQHHKWGFASIDGKMVIDPVFDSVGLFDEGFAEAYKAGKAGLINKNGSWIVPPAFSSVAVLDKNKQLFEVSKKITEKDSSTSYPVGIYKQHAGLLTAINYYSVREYNSYKYALEGRDEKNYLLNLNTNRVSRLYDKEYFNCGCGRDYRRRQAAELRYKQYLKNKPPLEELNTLYYFHKDGKTGGYIVYDTAYDSKAKKWVKFIDSMPAMYESIKKIENYYDDLFYVKLNNKWGLVNQKGKVIITPSFDSMLQMNHNEYFLVRENNKYGLYFFKGEQILDCTQDSIAVPCYFSDKFITAKKDGKWAVRIRHAAFNHDYQYDDIKIICSWRYQYAIIKKDSKYGIMDSAGNIIQPLVYENIIPRDSFLIYKLNGLYGVKNVKTGADIIKPAWSTIYLRNEKFFIVNRDGKFGVMLPFDNNPGNLFFPLSTNDNIEVVHLESKKDKKIFILFGIEEGGKYFYVGENNKKFTDEEKQP